MRKKTFTSKNLAAIIQTLSTSDKEDLVIGILSNAKFITLAKQVRSILYRRYAKKEFFEKTKVFTPLNLSQNALQQISSSTKMSLADAQIIIDKSVTAGAIIKSGPCKIDASLQTMLKNFLNQSLHNN
jgi:F0F1-type ATP synthase delta subunit